MAKDINAVFSLRTSSKTGFGISYEVLDIMWDSTQEIIVNNAPVEGCGCGLGYTCPTHRQPDVGSQTSLPPASLSDEEWELEGGFSLSDHVLFAYTMTQERYAIED